ncbi:MAG: hypothetical protein KDK39_11725, partial [Leptospiraceae bacterium]|nr:hypothetical protein [Leptospiraceae bacterium]
FQAFFTVHGIHGAAWQMRGQYLGGDCKKSCYTKGPGVTGSLMSKIQEYLQSENYAELIQLSRQMIRKDKRAWTDTALKTWLGRRFRNLFINEACKDQTALEAAHSSGFLGLGSDKRPERQQIAERFLRGDGPTEWQIEMPPAQVPAAFNATLLFSPGMLNGLLPVRAFQEAFPALQQKTGLKILRADLHPMRGCQANMADLKAAFDQGRGLNAQCEIITAEQAQAPGDVFIITYSKGMPDTLEFLVANPEVASRVRCIFNWAGATGGSYLADDILASIEDIPLEKAQSRIDSLMKMVSPVINMEGGALRRLGEFDIRTCIADTSTPVRSRFLEEHSETIDQMNIPIFNITGSTTVTEVPYFQIQGVNRLNTFDANNDMQVTQDQAKIKIPMATDLAMMHGHHWDLSYSPFPKAMRFGSPNLDHPFPKEAAATAMFQLAAELGLLD